MLNEGISISTLARETGIAEGTLYRWRHAAKPNFDTVTVTQKPSEKHSASQKFAILAEAASSSRPCGAKACLAACSWCTRTTAVP